MSKVEMNNLLNFIFYKTKFLFFIIFIFINNNFAPFKFFVEYKNQFVLTSEVKNNTHLRPGFFLLQLFILNKFLNNFIFLNKKYFN